MTTRQEARTTEIRDNRAPVPYDAEDTKWALRLLALEEARGREIPSVRLTIQAQAF